MNVAVVLSGCGHQDGAEIREAVFSLLYLDQQGMKVSIFAPDMECEEVNHLTGETTGQKRNVLAEAARIARGSIKPLTEAKAASFDALVMPGGFGAAKNLSDFAQKGEKAKVIAPLKTLIEDFYKQQKPIMAVCIAPAMLMSALSGIAKPKLTIGEDKSVASAIEAMGGTHQDCATDACVVDQQNRIITCSAYMRDDSVAKVAKGIKLAVEALAQMLRKQSTKAA